MSRESIVNRPEPFIYATDYVHYSIEKWFENYYTRPAQDQDYEIDSDLMRDLRAFFQSEFKEKPILIINTFAHREWFYEEPRKIINPVRLAGVLANDFEVVIKTEMGKEKEIAGCEKYIFKRLKMNARHLVAEKTKIASYQYRTFKNSNAADTYGLKFWIHDTEEFEKLQNKEILYFTAEILPNDYFFRLWNPRKVVCVQSFLRVKNPD